MSESVVPPQLEEVLADAWAQLHHATTTAKHSFHLPTLCTTPRDFDPSRDAPEARIVVLRHVEMPNFNQRHPPSVAAHTDARSPKAAQLREHAQATWLFYDGPARLQLRLTGPTQLLSFASTGKDLALVQTRWDTSNLSSRRCYLGPHAPGTPADAPSPNLPPEFRNAIPSSDAQTEPGKANFAVIRTRVATLDVLHLHHAGHRRAAYAYDDDGNVTRSTWLEV